MRTKRKCELCHRPLKSHGREELCPSCQKRLEDILDRHLELANIALTVNQAAQLLKLSPGHTRRILEHPDRYPWRDYGIADAHTLGKEWRIFLVPLEHRKELGKQLSDIRRGAFSMMGINAFLGLGPVLTPIDIQDLLEAQNTPLPPRKTRKEREEQIKRIRENMDLYVDRFFKTIAPMVTEKLKEVELLRSIASTGQPPRSAGAYREHQSRPD
jgi:hypothetical protein